MLPEHVKVVSQGDGSFVIAPIERSAVVYIWRSGAQPKQISTPIQSADDIFSADAFSVGTLEGPKFYILRVDRPKPKAEPNDAFNRAKKRLTGKSMLDEIKRQGVASFVTTKGGAWLQYYWTFVRTGTIFQPRYIIMFFLIGTGWIVGVVGDIKRLPSRRFVQRKQHDRESKEQIIRCQGRKDGDDRTFGTEVGRILSFANNQVDMRSRERWEAAFGDLSGDFPKLVQDEYRKIINDSENTKFFQLPAKQNPIAIFRKEAKFIGDANAEKVIGYMAATDRLSLDNEFAKGVDSMGKDMCLRGPLNVHGVKPTISAGITT